VHLWHEAAAWNAAVGAGFVLIALRRSRPTDALPMLTTFVALLMMVNAWDLFAGRIDQAELLVHSFLFAGYLVVLALRHPRLDPGTAARPRQRSRRRGRRSGSVDVVGSGAPQPPAGQPPLRLIHGQGRAAHPDRGFMVSARP
jgi:hypothetical protein